MILIFGGTTEGRIAIQTLEEAGKTFYYSTKGDEQDVLLHNGIRLQGAMDAIEIETFCAQHHIKLLIDAAHPFATQLHETLEQVSVESNIDLSELSVWLLLLSEKNLKQPTQLVSLQFAFPPF